MILRMKLINLKYDLDKEICMFKAKLAFVVLIASFLLTCVAVNVTQASAQSGGLRIAPVVKWTDNSDGNFDYCVYKGDVPLGTNIDNIIRYCLVSSEDSSLNNMNAYVDDGVDFYHLDDIVVPPNVINDGQEYTICVGFSPKSDSDYSIAESCQLFYNTQGSHVETPLVNLDRDACYDCDYD